MRLPFSPILRMILIATLSLAPRARAATLHVPADYPTIQSCIDAAISGQDECLVAPGTYNELINFLGKAITLRSSHGPELTTIDGTGLNGSVVTLDSDQTIEAALEGFTITGGRGAYSHAFGGGIFVHGDAFDGHQLHLVLRNVIVTGNGAGFGGGIFVSGEDMLTLSECEITENSAWYGGGIFGSAYAKIYVQGALFGANSAELNGGAIGGDRITLEVIRAEFAENTAQMSGGAIAIESGLAFGELAPTFGQRQLASALRNPTGVSISACVFESNEAMGKPASEGDTPGGGAIFAETNSFEVNQGTFRNNSASLGGAILDGYYSLHASQCLFLQNHADQDGGALYNYSSLESTSFLGNHAGRDGGGVFSFLFQGTPLENCFFVGNSAQRGGAWFGTGTVGGKFLANTAGQAGGAIYVAGPARVLDTLFTGNVSALGGALYNAGSASIYNATFVANRATDSGGAISNLGLEPAATSLSLISTILRYNSAPAHAQVWIDEKAYNSTIAACDIEGSGGSGKWDASFGIDLGNNLDVDPAFARQPDGGSDGFGDDPATPNIDESFNDDYGDLRLQPGSPCINTGDPALVPPPGETDLDGHARVLCGRVDMGAYEFGIGDYDCDQTVNLADLSTWPTCATDPAAIQSTIENRQSPIVSEPGAPATGGLPLPSGEGRGEGKRRSTIENRQSPIGCEALDFNADGHIDLGDFAAWVNLLQ